MAYDVTALLEKILNSQDLSPEEATWMMNQLMDGAIPPLQMSSILTALRMKGESVEEITACATVMREKATRIPVKPYDVLIDTCGTGGDKSGSFNISTTVAFLLAAGGYKIAKHGNRSMTSKSGSADVLESFGINLALSPEKVASCIDQVGIGFLFAPALHSAMKNVMPIRKELKVYTLFNILGPLTNPAGANVQVMGVFKHEFVSSIIRVLKALGTRSAYVVSGFDFRLDEVSLLGETKVARLTSNGKIEEWICKPEDYGFQRAHVDEIRGGTSEENATIMRQIFNGDLKGPKRDIVVLNAGFVISAADECSLEAGFAKAKTILDSGKCLEVIEKLAEYSNQ